MSFFKRFFGGEKSDDIASPLPWEQKPSLYDYIKVNVRPGMTGSEGYESLPDADRAFTGSQGRWAAGAMDGVATHHMGPGDSEDKAKELVKLVRDYCEAPSVKNKLAIYQHVMQVRTLSVVDPFLRELVGGPQPNIQRLYDLAISFATEATDREPVKLGVAMLGFFLNEQSKNIVRLLGGHDEFTLFAVGALTMSQDSSENDLWEIAKQVQGWGRIHAVERLVETENPEIKEWILRKGYKNWVMDEYLAYIAATTGGLLITLQQDHIDDELLAAAGDILKALINGGPAQCIDAYEEGAAATEYYLGHLRTQATRLSQLLVVNAIKDFLSQENADWDARAARGWTAERRTRLVELCTEIIGRSMWPELVRKELQSDDEQVYFRANRAASILGIDTWESHWKRLQDKPLEAGRWYDAMQSCGQNHIGDVLAFAERILPLQEIASGPAEEMGLGEGFKAHQCLGFVIQELSRFPGIGTRLLEAGLASPVLSNRNGVLRTFATWGKDAWPEGVSKMLSKAQACEPDGQVRETIQKVIDGVALA